VTPAPVVSAGLCSGVATTFAVAFWQPMAFTVQHRWVKFGENSIFGFDVFVIVLVFFPNMIQFFL
jgi:hypothetical protein